MLCAQCHSNADIQRIATSRVPGARYCGMMCAFPVCCFLPSAPPLAQRLLFLLRLLRLPVPPHLLPVRPLLPAQVCAGHSVRVPGVSARHSVVPGRLHVSRSVHHFHPRRNRAGGLRTASHLHILPALRLVDRGPGMGDTHDPLPPPCHDVCLCYSLVQAYLGLGSKAHESIKIYEAVSVISGILMLLGAASAFWHLFVGKYGSTHPRRLPCLISRAC